MIPTTRTHQAGGAVRLHHMEIPTPYLIFLGDAHDALAAKTGQGIADWRPGHCTGQLRLAGCQADLGLPELTPAEAQAAGAQTLVVGTVSPGGTIPEHWLPTLVDAVRAGLHIASGMHRRLGSFPELAAAANDHGRRLIDVRHSDQPLTTGSGEPRPGMRLLTVGTDCSVGKKYAALTIERELRARGVAADFRATGQTGILIAGSGIAVDAVVADFIAGAAEALAPANDPNHWDVIEGQGSLFHPSFGGVSLGLLHGAQPDAIVVCHEPTRTTMRNVAARIPDISAVIEASLSLGRLTNPAIRCAGIAVNTQALAAPAADAYLAELERRHGLPTCDPMRDGVANVVDHLLTSSAT